MNVKKHPIDNYKKFLLNRSTANIEFVEFIENMLAAEDSAANYSFHKIMVHNWNYKNELLFETITEYFTAWFIPVDVTKQRDITTFYSSNLNLILRLIRLDFLFPFDKNMFNIDVLFNDKSSVELFDNHIATEDIIAGVVTGRFNDKQLLDLSNFCSDQELKDKKLSFYKISLLANFKLLMLRIGRDTKSLDLSNNELTQPPLDIMNFFIKGDLTEINLSYNKINSISDLIRVSSKIEKLWLEGNPLCENHIEPSTYVKQITVKFPRLTELDGIKLNEFGVGFPLCRNYMCNPTKSLKMVVEKFLTLYFSHYDTVPRRKNIEGFYDDSCWLSITTGFTEEERLSIPSVLNNIGKSILTAHLKKVNPMVERMHKNRIYMGKNSALTVLSQLPSSQHDPTTFTVDLIRQDKKSMMLIVDGIFKDVKSQSGPTVFSFRRTFVFKLYKLNPNTTGYKIYQEMLHVGLPTEQQLANCFKFPIRNMNTFELINPEIEDIETLVRTFCHLSHLKKDDAETRLRAKNWDLKKAITQFISDVNTNKIRQDFFMEEDEFSDSSSLIDDEMVD